MFLSLLVGMGVLLGSLPLYGMATDLIVRLVARLIRRGYTDLGFWTTVTVMMIVTLITAVCHLTEQGMGELRSRMPYADLSAFDQNRRLTVVPDLFTVGLVVRYVEWKLGQCLKAGLNEAGPSPVTFNASSVHRE